MPWPVRDYVEVDDLTYDSDGDYQYERPGPAYGKSAYYIDEIVDVRYSLSKKRKVVKEYLVYWTGWSMLDATWEREDSKSFVDCPAVLAAFHTDHAALALRRAEEFQLRLLRR